jgi:hypothetical protein
MARNEDSAGRKTTAAHDCQIAAAGEGKGRGNFKVGDDLSRHSKAKAEVA